MKAKHMELTEVKFSLVMDGLKFHLSEKFLYNQNNFWLVKYPYYVENT